MTTPQGLVDAALAAARSPHCVAIGHHTSSGNLRWANNTLTTNGAITGSRLTVIAFRPSDAGISVGSVTGSALTATDAADLAVAADSAAASAEPAEDAAALSGDRETADWDEPPVPVEIEVYDSFAPALGEAFGRAGSEDRILYGFADYSVTTTYLGSSTGLRLRHVQPTGHYGCTAKSADLSRSAWLGGTTPDFGDVDPRVIEETLRRRLAWAERRVDLPPGRYDTVLPPTAVADLMIDAYWAAGARVAHEGQSVYSSPDGGHRVGEQIADRRVRLYSDPHQADVACLPFVAVSHSDNTASVFDNGLPLQATDWLTEGRLASLISTRHSAQLAGFPVTPFIDNLCLSVDGADGTVDDLVAGLSKGLLVTCLWYIREVDPQTLLLTGITRDGVYAVEDGEVVAAVNNFRFNESPVDLLGRFTEASTTVRAFSREWGDDYFSRTAMPALRIPDFNMSSVSQAT